ncbi:uncharacterized protein CLUP02_03484 [Colletotrichum lupini]|uniref:Uncharacterized protein n=1 Tax=Colletotrichum lupini TaxID=145971 RepID=A0A9Q8SJE3_9PEZI|nr:uncharacterized protein CLUP02_03484 [Colletotrichum lupini]UQC78010.1 hypothetical protein CLUP02_03484 [Colletotrichum lupini]
MAAIGRTYPIGPCVYSCRYGDGGLPRAFESLTTLTGTLGWALSGPLSSIQTYLRSILHCANAPAFLACHFNNGTLTVHLTHPYLASLRPLCLAS